MLITEKGDCLLKDESRRLLPRRLRAAAPPQVIEAARRDYQNYQRVCSRFEGCEPESWGVFYRDWLEVKFFSAKNGGQLVNNMNGRNE